MYKNATYKEKFAILNDWMPHIIESVKKDLKNEHLKNDPYFAKKFLAGKSAAKATNEELSNAYQEAIANEEKGEEIAEFITSRWLLKNSDLYDLFETLLSQIDSNFTELTEITPEQAKRIVEQSTREHGLANTYLFAVLNSVVFPNETFHHLEKEAKSARHEQKKLQEAKQEHASIEDLKYGYEAQIARLTDKYEKKLSGLQKKYHTDTEHLKKQVAALQRKFQAKTA